MKDVSILAIDLAKRSFQLCGTTADGEILFNRKNSRAKFEPFLTSHPPCLVAM